MSETNHEAGPKLFRLNIEVGDLDQAIQFYEELLGAPGRMQMGARCYFRAGPVTLQIVQVEEPHAAVKALYFSTGALDAVHKKASGMESLAPWQVHGTPAGDAVVRPWGERSFCAVDPWGNPLCCVEEGTIYAG